MIFEGTMGINIGVDIQKKNSEIKDCHHLTTSFIAKGVRTAFVIFGIVYVMYGFIKKKSFFFIFSLFICSTDCQLDRRGKLRNLQA